jgi:hypothetical protein
VVEVSVVVVVVVVVGVAVVVVGGGWWWYRAGRGEWSAGGWSEAGERARCRRAARRPLVSSCGCRAHRAGRGPKAPSERGSDEGLVSMKTQRRSRCDRRGRRDNACGTCVGVWGWGVRGSARGSVCGNGGEVSMRVCVRVHVWVWVWVLGCVQGCAYRWRDGEGGTVVAIRGSAPQPQTSLAYSCRH